MTEDVATKVIKEISKPATNKTIKFMQIWQDKGFDLDKRNESAIEAGFSPKSHSQVSRILQRIGNNKKMQRALKKENIDFNALAKKLNELLEAKHPQWTGSPDNIVRHKALETAIKIYDAFPTQKIDINETMRQEIIISADFEARLKKYEEVRGEFKVPDGEFLP